MMCEKLGKIFTSILDKGYFKKDGKQGKGQKDILQKVNLKCQ